MDLHILGSSSSGNCYILQNRDEALIIEAGVKLSDVKKALGFDMKKVQAVLISHEHGDHAGYVQDFLSNRMHVFMSRGTEKALKLKSNYLPMIMEAFSKFTVGGFTVMPFDVKHDCAEPLGFLIHHKECGKLLFVTDSYYVPYTFTGLNNLLIEANYSLDILMKNVSDGRMHGAMLSRTLQSHMSIETCSEALAANDLSNVNNIVLIHLSAGNSDAHEFKKRIERQTGKKTTIADKGMVINDFNITPF